MSKYRLDLLLVNRGLAPSRQRAQALILAGCVFVNDTPITKSGQMVDPTAKIEVKGKAHPYVSRGGVKLEHAIKEFKIDVKGKVCIDIGASTGGFTDCLVKHGAAKVYAIDVGYGQLAWELRNDPRVVALERTNIRHFDPQKLSTINHKLSTINLITIDVSFISLRLVFPAVDRILQIPPSPPLLKGGALLSPPLLKGGALLSPPLLKGGKGGLSHGEIIALIKPQFEVGKGKVGKGGIVRDEKLRQDAVQSVIKSATSLGWTLKGLAPSPITGADGNVEYLAYFNSKHQKLV